MNDGPQDGGMFRVFLTPISPVKLLSVHELELCQQKICIGFGFLREPSGEGYQMPGSGRSFGQRVEDLCFHKSGDRGCAVLPTDWRDLPMKKRNFVETESSLYKVTWCEFVTADVALNPDHKPKNNTDYNCSRNCDPILDHAIFLRVRRSRLNR